MVQCVQSQDIFSSGMGQRGGREMTGSIYRGYIEE